MCAFLPDKGAPFITMLFVVVCAFFVSMCGKAGMDRKINVCYKEYKYFS